MQGNPNRPIPVPSSRTEPYWAAAKKRQLAIQRCSACGHYNNPPEPMCPACFSSNLSFTPVSGRGKIYSAVINRQPMVQGFQEAIPYAVIGVELEEQDGLLVLTNLVESPPEEAKVGRPVEVTFEEIDGGMVLPQFRLRKGR